MKTADNKLFENCNYEFASLLMISDDIKEWGTKHMTPEGFSHKAILSLLKELVNQAKYCEYMFEQA